MDSGTNGHDAPVRWGILGSGRVADGFARGLAVVPGAPLVAVASRRHERAVSFASRHGDARVHDGYEALATDPDVDVVYVATPNDRHADDALLCLANGKAVLCEKPFTLDAGQAAQVVAAARSHRLFCMEGMWMRFIPAIRRVAELVHDGAIGELRSVHADFSNPVAVDPTSRFFDPARGGGALLDLGVYTLSFAQMLLGEPTEVGGRLAIGPTGVDEQAAVVLGYDGGATAVLTSSLRTRGPNHAVVAGTRGTIRVAGPLCAPTRFTVERVEPSPAGGEPSRLRELVLGHPVTARAARAARVVARGVLGRGTRASRLPLRGNGYEYEIAEVNDRIRAGELESAVMPLDDSVRVMQLIDRLRAQLG